MKIVRKKSGSNRDYLTELKADNFKSWYQFICPLLWVASVFAPLCFFTSGDYGVIVNFFIQILGIVVYNFLMWLIRRYFYKKYPRYKYKLKQVDLSKLFTAISVFFILMIFKRK